MVGDFSVAAHSTVTMPARYLASKYRLAFVALVVHLLAPLRNQSGSFTEGMGIHARVVPSGFRISTRVMTSKLRQPAAGLGSKPCVLARRGNAAATESAPPALRNVRRSMMVSL